MIPAIPLAIFPRITSNVSGEQPSRIPEGTTQTWLAMSHVTLDLFQSVS